MRHSTASLVITALLFACCATVALAQVTPDKTAPPTAKPNVIIMAKPGSFAGQPTFDFGPPFGGYIYQTPASLGCIYNLVAVVDQGCNPNLYLPNSASTNPAGGSKAIAIVDAYDDPTAAADLGVFSFQFGLPFANFTKVYARFGGTTPGSCTGFFAPTPPSAVTNNWDVEESLDIEWAHAMAPAAHIYLVEAQSDSFADLFCAETTAAGIVAGYGSITPPPAVGGGEVSNSWGCLCGEFSNEATYDGALNNPNVVTFFSTGDFGGTEYPSTSPLVVAVGGTSLFYNTDYDFQFETVWNNIPLCGALPGGCGFVTGGGVSAYETKPAFQDGVSNALLSFNGAQHRGVPDVSAVGDPYTGVWVYDSNSGGWFAVGGTSAATPIWAGIVNNASTRSKMWSSSSQIEAAKLYGDPNAISGTGPADTDFNDITFGNCNPTPARTGYDTCSGLGSPKAFGGK